MVQILGAGSMIGSMTIIDLAWLIAGACFGFAAGVPLAERVRRRQVRAIVAAYEARIAELRGGAR